MTVLRTARSARIDECGNDALTALTLFIGAVFCWGADRIGFHLGYYVVGSGAVLAFRTIRFLWVTR